MHLKDYYRILEIETSATIPEIKKAYRKLALQYHPDKNQSDAYSTARFSEVKEAYEILTNPSKKEYYLQQRWYNQSIGKRKTRDIITPVTILKQALELEKYVSKLDVFRMDKSGLQEYILDLVSNSNIEELKKFKETATNRQIISTIIKAMKPLPMAYTGKITAQLEKLSDVDEISGNELASFAKKLNRKNSQEKYSLIIIISVTLILCLLIYLGSR